MSDSFNDQADEAPADTITEGAGDTAGAPVGSVDGADRADRAEPKPSYYEGGAGASSEPGGDDEFDHGTDEPVVGELLADTTEPVAEGDALAAEDAAAASYLADLQRLQAEYVNYKKRVDRDRDVIRSTAVVGVVEALLPVLDDIHMAREHGDLAGGPFASIAEKLESTLGRFGVERVGESGQEFDPTIHEALMHVEADLPEEATATTVVQVLQPGYKIGERLVRAARVSVADPA